MGPQGAYAVHVRAVVPLFNAAGCAGILHGFARAQSVQAATKGSIAVQALEEARHFQPEPVGPAQGAGQPERSPQPGACAHRLRNHHPRVDGQLRQI